MKVIMTKLAKEFITPLTLATLSKNPILVDFFNPENGEWNSHVSLGEWADGYLIAPVTANSMGKMCTGVADNLLITTYLSARCPVFIAPAMDLDMYKHITTQNNLATLKSHGVHIIEPESGELASGLVGKGRMAEPEHITEYMINFFNQKKTLQGKKALITTGGTVEKIDAVRFISNYSTGKMGYSIAKELSERGAEVTVVRANVNPSFCGSLLGVKEVEALSAADMCEAVDNLYSENDIIVMAAAVADYTPKNPSELKVKKMESMSVELTQTTDIAAMVGAKKRENQFLVGFALESHSALEYAQSKLEKKNLDFIVLNTLEDEGAGFGHNTNKVTIIDKDGAVPYPLKGKERVAVDIVDNIEKKLGIYDN